MGRRDRRRDRCDRAGRQHVGRGRRGRPAGDGVRARRPGPAELRPAHQDRRTRRQPDARRGRRSRLRSGPHPGRHHRWPADLRRAHRVRRQHRGRPRDGDAALRRRRHDHLRERPRQGRDRQRCPARYRASPVPRPRADPRSRPREGHLRRGEAQLRRHHHRHGHQGQRVADGRRTGGTCCRASRTSPT